MAQLILLGVIAFFGLAWLGRLSKDGKLKKGSWIKQGRALSGFIAVAVAFGGYAAMMKGLVVPGVVMIVGALIWLVGLKFNLRMVAEKSGVADGISGAFDFKTREALQVLGLSKNADKAAIISAWREKMKSAHPDAGGTQKEAAKINAARDHLLKAFKA